MATSLSEAFVPKPTATKRATDAHATVAKSMDTRVTADQNSFTSAFNSICAAVGAVTRSLKVPKTVRFAATASALVNKHFNRRNFEIEWIDDSGAGRHLASAKDLIRQGIPGHLVK